MKKVRSLCGNIVGVSYTPNPNIDKSQPGGPVPSLPAAKSPTIIPNNNNNILNNLDYLNIQYNNKNHKARIKKCYDSIMNIDFIKSDTVIKMFASKRFNITFGKRNLLIEISHKSLGAKIEKFDLLLGGWGSSGYIFAPYIPVQITNNTIFEVDSVIEKATKSIRSRYASKTINASYYGELVVGTQPAIAW